MTDSFPNCSNSEEGTWSLSRQKLTQLVNQLCADFGKRFEGCFLWAQLQLEKNLRGIVLSTLDQMDLFSQTRFSRISDWLLHSHRGEPEPDEGQVRDSTLRDGSPSPSGSWSLPSLESVGITSEEWATRGWNVFFGAWD